MSQRQRTQEERVSGTGSGSGRSPHHADGRCACGEETDGLLLCTDCCRDSHGDDLEVDAVEGAQLDHLAEVITLVFTPTDTGEAA
jgi:hypothetical protein